MVMAENKISRSLMENEKKVKEILGESSDVIIRHFVIPAFNNCRAFILLIDGLIDTKEIDDIILRPLMANSQFQMQKNFIYSAGPIRAIKEAGILATSVKEVQDWNKLFDAVLSGETILFIESCDTAIDISTRGWETRAVSEPVTESEVRAPRDGFIESIRTNTALMRRRIRDYSLRLDSMKIGVRTKTDVVIAYIDNLADKNILKELKSRIDRIDIDSILESGYIEEFIEDSPFSLFPTIEHTERPDKAAAAVLEGKIVIMIDNTPFVLIIPTTFWRFIQAPGDYYERTFVATFLRIIRAVALLLSLTLSSLYIMLVSFHQEMLPTPLALRMAAGREGVPFPAIMEVLFMETMFEIIKEAGLRMPKPVGQAVSIVGALVIGDAAVNAGLVSPTLLVIVAMSGISSFAIPSYSVTISFRLLRFGLIFLTGFLGILGFLGGTITIMLHLLSLRSFGAPFLAPISPIRKSGLKDLILRAPWWSMNKRPLAAHPQDENRAGEIKDINPQVPKK
jgi:spore germination protein KA